MNYCSNIDKIQESLVLFQKDMERREIVETSFGPQKVSCGYQIKEVSIYEGFVSITVYMEERKTKNNDIDFRGGDTAYFRVIEGKVYQEQEWLDYVETLDKEEPER